jgi:hypothetical protein
MTTYMLDTNFSSHVIKCDIPIPARPGPASAVSWLAGYG